MWLLMAVVCTELVKNKWLDTRPEKIENALNALLKKLS